MRSWVYCGESKPVIKKGATGKGARQDRCKESETSLYDITDSFFEYRKFPIEEMFHMSKEMRSVPSAQNASDLDRDDEAVSNFRHDLQELCAEWTELTLSDVCEADDLSITSGEKGIEKEEEEGVENLCERGLKILARKLRVRQTVSRDTRPSLRRTGGVSGSKESPGRRRRGSRER